MFAIFTFEAPEGCFSSFLFMFSFLYPFVVVVVFHCYFVNGDSVMVILKSV